jgi:hypothetical protein
MLSGKMKKVRFWVESDLETPPMIAGNFREMRSEERKGPGGDARLFWI